MTPTLFEMLLSRLDKLKRDQLVSALLESRNDLPDESALDAIRLITECSVTVGQQKKRITDLDHDVGTFCIGHVVEWM